MKIAALRLYNVRRFAGRGVALENIGDGVNVLSAANEQGKSTSFEALHALFFSPHGSTARDVQSLRPYSGGNSLIEADVETSRGRYRLTKRFHGSRLARVADLTNGRLIAQADEAEAFIADLVQGGMAGPAGLLWVRQGLTGIEERSKKEEENEKSLRAGLLESVQGEVEAVTGGRRMSEVRDRVEAELGRLVTATGRPKANEAYAIALADVDRLAAEEAKLADEVRKLRADLDKRTETQRALRESDVPERQQVEDAEIAEAEATRQAAQANRQALEAADAKRALVTRDRDTARAALAAFDSNIRLETELAREVSAREAARTAAQQARDQVRALRNAASARRDTADVAEKAARAAVQALERHRRAADARDRLLRAESNRDQADALRKQIEANEAEAARLAISDTDIAALATAEQVLFRQRTLAEMARPAVTFRYAAGTNPDVRLNGDQLADGERRSFDGAADIDIAGVGLLHLETAAPAGGHAALREAEDRFATMLAKMSVTGVAEARQRHRDAETARNGVQQAREKLKILAPQGLPALLREIATLRADALPLDDLSPLDEPAILAAHDAAQRELAEAEAALKGAAAGEDPANDAFARAEAELAVRTSEWNAIQGQLGAAALRDERRAALLADVGRLTAAADTAEQERNALAAQSADVDAATARLNRLRSAAESRRRHVADLKVMLAGLEAAIRTQADLAVEERWNEVRDLLAQAQQRAAAYANEVEVLTTLRDALDAARTRARDTYLSPVIGELRPLLGLLFDDVGIEFDEKTLLPVRLTRNGLHEDVDRLSGGMREQLSILTRLAFARLLAQDGRPAPVILDDALVYSDDDRIEKMFDALHRQASNQQIIVFSCRQRAFQRLGGNVLTMTDWVPPDL